jgi:hypothetical protein
MQSGLDPQQQIPKSRVPFVVKTMIEKIAEVAGACKKPSLRLIVPSRMMRNRPYEDEAV